LLQKCNSRQIKLVVVLTLKSVLSLCTLSNNVLDVFAVRNRFLPCDAVLARYMLSSCVRPSVRPSVRHKPVLYRNDWTKRLLACRLSSTHPKLCCVEIRVSKNWAISIWDFEPNFGIRKFRHSKSIALSLRPINFQTQIRLGLLATRQSSST